MDARFYNSEDIDIQRLASDIQNVYLSQGYQVQQIGNADQVLVQLKKGSDFEAIIGMQAAISLTIQRTTGGVLAMIGQQRWLDKAAVGAVGIVAFPVLWPLALTAGAGALRQASLGNQVLNVVDGLVRQQRPGIIAGPVPQQLLPGVQSQWGAPPQIAAPQQQQQPYYIPSNQVVEGSMPPPQLPPTVQAPLQQAPLQPVPDASGSGLHCPQCNTPYENGDTFCTGCGRPLTAPRQYCPKCNSELKPGIAFCPKCGASTFQTTSAQQTARAQTPPPQPTYQPPARPQTPVYTPPPTPPMPVYQPPVRKPDPTPVYKTPTPAYTPPTTQNPPSQPQPQVYYVPSSQPQTPKPPEPKKEEVYYVPPTTQQPKDQPQPRVTIVSSTPHQAPPPPQKPRPQKQYYIPSNSAAQKAHEAASQPTIPDQPARTPDADHEAPTVEDSVVPVQNAPTIAATPAQSVQGSWGTLTFGNGQQSQLASERVVIGRYDHDLGGLQPEVDLGQYQGADTVSRVHASFELAGSDYLLTDLNSTNATRINGNKLVPDVPTPVKDGDTVEFGKVSCTFKRA